ncbi:MAG TPA: tetratricopeptide repeat protein [Gemmatimonadaceae bacterium]
MSRGMRGRALAALVLVAPLSGCLASKGDVRLLQDELRALRASVAASDTARRAQSDSVYRLAARTRDSLTALAGRVGRFQADVNGALYDMGRQLITIQELTGQSQRRLQELRATLEDRSSMPAPEAAPPLPADSGQAAPGRGTTTPPAAPAEPSLPGPNRLFQVAKDQLDRGSPRAAREAFDTLIVRYPTADVVPTAQFFVAEAYAREGKRAAADSVYELVATRYPRADRASTALYKLALSRRAAGDHARAKALLERIVKDYPRSDEAALATDQLRTMR